MIYQNYNLISIYMPTPTDIKLYNTIKDQVYIEIPKHSAYRSGILVQRYKKAFFDKYGKNKSPYKGKKTRKKGLKRWFDEEWVNQRGEIGYKFKNDIYRPKIRITDDTPITHDELTSKEIKKARIKKYKKGRVNRFRKDKKSGGDIIPNCPDYTDDEIIYFYPENDFEDDNTNDEFEDDNTNDDFGEIMTPEEIFTVFQNNYIFYVNECFDKKLADIMNSNVDDIKNKEKELIDNLINIKNNEVKIDLCNNLPYYEFPYEPDYMRNLLPSEKNNLLTNVYEQLKANILTIEIDRNVFISEEQLKELDDMITNIWNLCDDNDILNNFENINQKDIFPNISMTEPQFAGIKCFVLIKNVMENAIYKYLYPDGNENDFDNMELDIEGGGKWSKKYKKSINCNKPKGFSQKQYCKYSKNKTRKYIKPIKKSGSIFFKDHPDFTPNLTPREMFKMGSFGGTYWRPIYSGVVKKNLKNVHKKYPNEWWRGIPESHLSSPEYDESINNYKVTVGTSLEFWESKNWIKSQHPYGWVHWYCDFYMGKRSDDDLRQISRWKQLAGPSGRFMRFLVTQILRNKKTWDDESVSPKIRQVLQHWGYKLTEKDFNYEIKRRSKK